MKNSDALNYLLEDIKKACNFLSIEGVTVKKANYNPQKDQVEISFSVGNLPELMPLLKNMKKSSISLVMFNPQLDMTATQIEQTEGHGAARLSFPPQEDDE